MRFASKLGIVGAAAALIIGPLLGAAVFLLARTQLQEGIVQTQVQVAARVMGEIDNALRNGQGDVEVIAADNFLREYLEAPSAHRAMADTVADELAERAELTGPWDGMAVFDREGTRIFAPAAAGDVGGPADSPLTRIAFERAMTGKTYASDRVICPRTRQPVVIFAAPVFGRDAPGQVVGAVVAHYTWQPIQDILDRVEDTAMVHLLDNKGEVIGQRSSDHQYAPQAEAHLVREALDGRAGYSILHRSSHGGGASLAVDLRQEGGHGYADHGWRLLLEMPLDVMFAPIVKLARNTGLLVFGALLVMAVVFAALGRRFIRPLKELVVGVRQLEGGRFDQKVAVHSTDEFGELAGRFNAMVDRLRQAQEELVRQGKLAMLGQVASSVGRELRNPLGAMSNAVYLLQSRQDGTDEAAMDYLAIIRDEIARSERIVAALLEAVQTRAPVLAPCGVAELLEQTLRSAALPAGVTVRRDVPTDVPAVRVDAGQIQQVLANLLSNAADAMAGGGVLEIRAAATEAEGAVTIAVSDTGCGIAPENMARLFQPLFTTKARGIGLGLVVVKNLVEANGGKIEVQSEPGKGTTVSVTLPAADDPDQYQG